MGLRKNFHSILRCHSHSRSRSFPGITKSHYRSQNLGMESPFPFPFPKIGNEIFIPVPVPKSWECNLSFPFLFPKFGNGLSHSRSRSQMSKSHSRSPLPRTIRRTSIDKKHGANTLTRSIPEPEVFSNTRIRSVPKLKIPTRWTLPAVTPL